MSGFIVIQGANVQCMHLGTAQPTRVYPRVTVDGQPIVTLSCAYAISGCNLASIPAPICATGQWTVGAMRLFAGGESVVLFDSQSQCVSTGAPMRVVRTQTRASGT